MLEGCGDGAREIGARRHVAPRVVHDDASKTRPSVMERPHRHDLDLRLGVRRVILGVHRIMRTHELSRPFAAADGKGQPGP